MNNDSAIPATGPTGLRRTLKMRHMQMIALGGVIGAGLFVGSGVVIQATGPAAVLSFALTGTLRTRPSAASTSTTGSRSASSPGS